MKTPPLSDAGSANASCFPSGDRWGWRYGRSSVVNRRGSFASRSTDQTCAGLPADPPTYTICFSSALQEGSRRSPAPRVRQRGLRPSASQTQIWPRDTKAIRAPEGDHAGVRKPDVVVRDSAGSSYWKVVVIVSFF